MTANQIAYQNVIETRRANDERERTNRANERISERGVKVKEDQSPSQIELNTKKAEEAKWKAYKNRASGTKDYFDIADKTINRFQDIAENAMQVDAFRDVVGSIFGM